MRGDSHRAVKRKGEEEEQCAVKKRTKGYARDGLGRKGEEVGRLEGIRPTLRGFVSAFIIKNKNREQKKRIKRKERDKNI